MHVFAHVESLYLASSSSVRKRVTQVSPRNPARGTRCSVENLNPSSTTFEGRSLPAAQATTLSACLHVFTYPSFQWCTHVSACPQPTARVCADNAVLGIPGSSLPSLPCTASPCRKMPGPSVLTTRPLPASKSTHIRLATHVPQHWAPKFICSLRRPSLV